MPTCLILSVTNDISTDQRVHRIASCLHEMGYEVLVVGRTLPHSLPLPERRYRMHRMRLWFRRGKFFYLEYNLRLFFFLLSRKVHLLNANDLDTLLANFLVARLKGIPLVYDSHEYFTEVPELVHRPRTRRLWLSLERWIFPQLQHAYTVNDQIARVYSQAYGVAVKVVRNVPLVRVHPNVGRSLSPRILIYQGALNLGRGIDLMIRAMSHLPGDVQLWIAGDGDVAEALRELTQEQGLSARVKFWGRVPMDELMVLTCQASLGFSLEEDLGANYRYASPNKVFDYIQARVPVLVSDLPVMRALVEEHGVGEVLPEEARTPRGLAGRVQRMLSQAPAYERYVQHCQRAAEQLNWEQEQTRLQAIYHNAYPPSPPAP